MEQLSLKSSIPEAKIAAVEKALQTAFNTTTIEDIELLTGGLSGAIVYKIIVGGKPYALRLIMRIDPLNDPMRQYTCMNIAAEAGIAPYVYYSSVEDALSISDFIDAKPLFGYSIVSDELLLKLVETIRAIHSTKLFPKLVNFLDGVDGFIAESWWAAGSHLNEIFGSRYAVIGSAVGVSDDNGIGQPENGTLEAQLTALPGAVRFIPTHKGEGLATEEITALPTRSGSMKNPSYVALTPQSFTDFDWLAVLNSTVYNRGGAPLQQH